MAHARVVWLGWREKEMRTCFGKVVEEETGRAKRTLDSEA